MNSKKEKPKQKLQQISTFPRNRLTSQMIILVCNLLFNPTIQTTLDGKA